MFDEHAIIDKVLKGDMHALQILIDQYSRLVVHIISRYVTSREDVEELAQDVFVKVHQQLFKFRYESKLATWIANIAHNTTINHLKKKKYLSTELTDEELLTQSFSNRETPEKLAAEKDFQTFIERQIDQLPPQYKIVLTLYHLEDMNYTEIYQATGMPEGTVKNYLFRARKLLKEKLKNFLALNGYEKIGG